jgi:hypothetical protein
VIDGRQQEARNKGGENDSPPFLFRLFITGTPRYATHPLTTTTGNRNLAGVAKFHQAGGKWPDGRVRLSATRGEKPCVLITILGHSGLANHLPLC